MSLSGVHAHYYTSYFQIRTCIQAIGTDKNGDGYVFPNRDVVKTSQDKLRVYSAMSTCPVNTNANGMIGTEGLVTPPRKRRRGDADDDVYFSSQESQFCDIPGHLNVSSQKNWRHWSVDDVATELESFGLTDIAQKFKDEEIDGSCLPYLTDPRLKEIGIQPMGKILKVNKFLDEIGCYPGQTDVMDNAKIFNDPIHGHIEVHPLCVKIIDTPQFQRLRYLKQLGACYFVFPGAAHNRFEHCIGVCYLAGQLARALKKRQPELKMTDEDVLCVEIAGLCHDLGHGPFSHMFDGEFIPLTSGGRKWMHEDASVLMFDHLVEENDLVPSFEEFNLAEQDRIFIKEQICGPSKKDCAVKTDWPYRGRDKQKRFLYEIVANKRNGIDVDKWDYFARDCHHLGINNNFDHTRFMKFARVIEVEGQLQICSRDKEVGNLYDMFHTRNALHRRAYQHKVNKIIETMIVEALIKANDIIKIPGRNGKLLKMSECIDDMVAYTHLTDHVFHQILMSDDPALEESQQILNNIHCRRLYKCVGQSQPSKGHVVKDDQISQMKNDILDSMLPDDHDAEDPLSPDSIVVQVVYLDYGMKEKNPIDHVRFYDKASPNQPVRVSRNQVSVLLPETFAEQVIRVYCKDRDEVKLGIAARCFVNWCKKNNMKEPKQSGFELTPLIKQGSNPRDVFPSTPKTNSTPPNMQETPYSAGKFRTRLSF